MILQTFQNAGDFLRAVKAALEANEAANNLMYGLALRLQRYPERIETPPYYAVVRHKRALQAACLMTPPYNLQAFAAHPESAAAAFALAARDLRQRHWPVPGTLGPSQAALEFARAWQALTGEPYRLAVHERVYELRQVIPPPQPPGRMRPATPQDQDLVARWLFDFNIEAVPETPITLEQAHKNAQTKISDGDLFLWEDGGRPVALAGRNRPTPNGYCIGPVYSPPEQRRKGYATALTAGLSQLLLDSGKKFTALFTNLANPTSNSIYQKIGYRPVCDFDLYLFG